MVNRFGSALKGTETKVTRLVVETSSPLNFWPVLDLFKFCLEILVHDDLLLEIVLLFRLILLGGIDLFDVLLEDNRLSDFLIFFCLWLFNGLKPVVKAHFRDLLELGLLFGTEHLSKQILNWGLLSFLREGSEKIKIVCLVDVFHL